MGFNRLYSVSRVITLNHLDITVKPGITLKQFETFLLLRITLIYGLLSRKVEQLEQRE